MPYALIIFDFDGTLRNTLKLAVDNIQMAYKALQEEAPSEVEIEKVISQGVSAPTIFALLSPDLSESSRQILLEKYKEVSVSGDLNIKEAPLFEGSEEILTQLQKAGIYSAIASNKPIDELGPVIKVFELESFINVYMGAQLDGLCKPNPDFYNNCLKPHFPNISPQEILMVGDTKTDLLFAKAIEADACWASYGHGDAEECKALGPKYTIQALKELEAILFPRSTLGYTLGNK